MTATDPNPTRTVQPFCWAELAAADASAACRFYADLVGWSYLTLAGEQGVYHLIQPATGHGGGIMGLMQPGQQSAWTSYVQVEGLEDRIARARDLGARLLVGPEPVPGGGRIAYLQDPEGVVFGLYGAAADAAPLPANDAAAGVHFGFHELRSRDPREASLFYGSLFGWEFQERSVGGEPCLLVDPGRGCRGGIVADEQPGWLPYLQVGGIEEFVARSVRLGGALHASISCLEAGRSAVLRDPLGARIGVFEPGRG